MFRKSMITLLGPTMTCYLIFSGVMVTTAYAGPNAGALIAVDLDVGAPGIQSTNSPVPVGDNLKVDVVVQGTSNLRGADFNLLYDSGAVEVVSVKEGGFLKSGGEQTFFIKDTNTSGAISVSTVILGPTAPCVNDTGVLARITFQIKGEQNSGLSFSNVRLTNCPATQDDYITSNAVGGTITVDSTKPTVTEKTPDSGVVSVPLNQAVVITFSEAMQTGVFLLTSSPDPGGWSCSWNDAETKVICFHDTFTLSTDYTLEIAGKDKAGNSMNTISWSFKTTRPPKLMTIGDKSVNEGSALSFEVTATNPDTGDTISCTVENLPGGAAFANSTFTWIPGYDQAGAYSVIFIATDNQGNSDSEAIIITVNNVCLPSLEVKADFMADSTSGCAPLKVCFADSSAGEVISYLWDFGDGDSSSDSGPCHTYHIPGTYTITLTVNSECESNSEIKAAYVTVDPCLPDVRINEVAFKEETNDWIEFYIGGTYLGGLRVYQGTSLVKEFPDIHASAGDYVVLHFNADPANDEDDTTGEGANGYWDIYTTDAGLSDTDDVIRLQKPGTSLISSTTTIDAFIYSNKDGDFTGSKSVANELVAAGLWDTEADFNTGDFWVGVDSDDVSSGTSVGRNRASIDSNSSSDWFFMTAQSLGMTNCPAPEASFTAGITSGYAPLLVCFTDSSTGEITGWAWDLDGDGRDDATIRNPCYTYDAPDTYTVTLEVSGACGSDSEIEAAYIEVVNPPGVDEFLVDFETYNYPNPFYLDDREVTAQGITTDGTIIKYVLPERVNEVRIKIYTIL